MESAIRKKRADVIELLLEEGIDINLSNFLKLAVRIGSERIQRALVDWGAPSDYDYDTEPILYCAHVEKRLQFHEMCFRQIYYSLHNFSVETIDIICAYTYLLHHQEEEEQDSGPDL